jgi:hypothetical protein
MLKAEVIRRAILESLGAQILGFENRRFNQLEGKFLTTD